VRCDNGRNRSRQVLHRGVKPVLLEPNRAMLDAVESQLMPQVLNSGDASCWPELTNQLPWSRAFRQAGLTSVAGVPLRASADPQGVLWIARHGGELIGRHHIYLLETLAPLIAARLESAEMRRFVHEMELTDPVTDLPNRRSFEQHVQRLSSTGEPWTAAVVGVDQFARLSELSGDHEGEHLLRAVAAAIRSVTRRSTYVARVGQSLFGVVVPGLPVAAAGALGERISQALGAIEVPLREEDGTIGVTASIGVAGCPDDGQAGLMVAEVALARAENARRAGGGHIVASGGLADRQAG
jgi:diguanylate cyclase (GGDEF)-like protein